MARRINHPHVAVVLFSLRYKLALTKVISGVTFDSVSGDQEHQEIQAGFFRMERRAATFYPSTLFQNMKALC